MNEMEMKLVKVLRENITVPEMGDEALLKSDMQSLGINSLNFIKLIVGIEQEFDIEIDDSQLNYQLFGKVSDILTLVQEMMD